MKEVNNLFLDLYKYTGHDSWYDKQLSKDQCGEYLLRTKDCNFILQSKNQIVILILCSILLLFPCEKKQSRGDKLKKL